MLNIPNTTIEPKYNSNGKLLAYRITIDEGYSIHNKTRDIPIRDEERKPTGEVILGFTTGIISVGYNYDFDNVVEDTYTYTDENGKEVSIPVKKIGRFELYTLPTNIVPKTKGFEVQK